jgi:hypothetical protein
MANSDNRFPIFNSGFFDSLWNRTFRKKKNKTNSSQGSIYPLGYTTQYNRKLNLEIPFQPVRPVKNSYQNSIELIELATWSFEGRHSISTISRDIFQNQEGQITSWSVADTYKDKKINKDVLAIANDLSTRTNGKDLVLGGDFLQRAVRDFLFYGDAFVSLGFDKDGISKNWQISESLYLPPLSTFVDIDEQNKILSYSQRESVNQRENDILIHPLKMLHFSYEKDQIYGNPITFQSLEAWRKLKEVSQDLEQASRDTGYSILVHTLPENVSELDKESYQARYEDMLHSGIVTNLYLLPGMQVERIAAESGALEPLIKNWLQLRYQCIPPGLPLYLFPGLGIESTAGKEIATQPAMNYARLIASIRGMLAEQIKWAISLEIVLTRGYYFFTENRNFDIVWGDWFVTGLESEMMKDDPKKPEAGSEKPEDKD